MFTSFVSFFFNDDNLFSLLKSFHEIEAHVQTFEEEEKEYRRSISSVYTRTTSIERTKKKKKKKKRKKESRQEHTSVVTRIRFVTIVHICLYTQEQFSNVRCTKSSRLFSDSFFIFDFVLHINSIGFSLGWIFGIWFI